MRPYGLTVVANPPWVKEKIASVAQGQLQPCCGLRARDVRKLCQEGRLKEALRIVELNIQQGLGISINTFFYLLQGSIKTKALTEGKQVHHLIIKSGFESNILLGNSLVNLYAKCGSVLDARQVLDNMPQYSISSWTAIISAYAKLGQGEEALHLFQQMQVAGVVPDKFVFVFVLKACASLAALEQGKQIHAQIMKSGIGSNFFLETALVDMYGKCGSIEDARQVFNKMRERSVVSWNVMISGYAQHVHGEEALTLFEQMQLEGMKPDKVTFISVLKACASLGALERGKQIHAQMIQSGLDLDRSVESSLVDMYGKCGSLEDAFQVFNQMRERDVIAWNAMIVGYARQGHGKKALLLFERMQKEGMKPDRVTFASILKACGSLSDLELGKQVHAQFIKSGLKLHVVVENSLVDMYGKCGSLEDARQVFNKMEKRDVVSWTVIIGGYAQQGHAEEALILFEQMQQEGIKPDKVTFLSILKACASLAALEWAKQIHSQIIQSGLGLDVFVENSLIDTYGKCRSIEDARQVFNSMRERDVVTWNAMIAGYVQQGHDKEALTLFDQMQCEGMKPDQVTFVSILKACASLAALERGKQLHAQIIQSGLDLNVVVENSLVDMYGKCGSLEDACKVFNKMHERDIISWTTMIAGYAQQGHGKEALILFERMQDEGIKPDMVTFVCVLSACSHAGLVDEGFRLFDSLSQDHGITPTLHHYCCMVDLLGRAGRLYEAKDFICKMPVQPDAVVWTALLGACRSVCNVELGVHAFECILKLDPKCAAAYVLLSNIFATAGRWDEVARIRKEMEDSGVKKEPGCSWIEVNGKVHAFLVGDTTHPQSKEIYAELKRLTGVMKEVGYVPDLSFSLHDMGDEQKKDALCDHSEKLAIGFGLISTPPGTPIRIKENLRVCGDGHNATKIISKIVGREIIARDANRFHLFKDGLFSCGDYW